MCVVEMYACICMYMRFLLLYTKGGEGSQEGNRHSLTRIYVVLLTHSHICGMTHSLTHSLTHFTDE